jgi:sugar (pentulose or hexulose) kinase
MKTGVYLANGPCLGWLLLPQNRTVKVWTAAGGLREAHLHSGIKSGTYQVGNQTRRAINKTGNNAIEISTPAGDEASRLRALPTAQPTPTATVAAAALAGPHPGVLRGAG